METILIVDDEKNYLLVLKELLGEEGYEVVTAQSASEALDIFQEMELDLVITDMRMPGKSGMELLQKMRFDFPGIPVIVATGVADTNVAAECAQLGVVDFIIKPFDLQAVTASVRKSLSRLS